MARVIFLALVLIVIAGFAAGLRPDYPELILATVFIASATITASFVMKSLFRGMFR